MFKYFPLLFLFPLSVLHAEESMCAYDSMNPHMDALADEPTVSQESIASGNYTANNTNWVGTRISASATNGIDIPQEHPFTLTWGIVPDGTQVGTFGGGTPISNLISAFDLRYGGNPVGANISDLTQRPWFPIVASTFETVSNRCGIQFVYEPNDDGLHHDVREGELGVRADYRMAGKPNNDAFFAYNGFPENGRIQGSVFLTDRLPENTASYQNIQEHESMHGLGFDHNTIDGMTNWSLLGFISAGGPQYHDTILLQKLYGDPYEFPNRNETIATAVDLGSLDNATVIRGADWKDTLAGYSKSDRDLTSLSSSQDVDLFRFEISSESILQIILEPKGFSYSIHTSQFLPGEQFDPNSPQVFSHNSKSYMNLQFELLDSNGTIIETVGDNAAGMQERLDTTLSAGTYFVKVAHQAGQSEVQAYALELSTLDRDSDGDGKTDSTEAALSRDLSTASDLGFEFDGVDLIPLEGWVTGGTAASAVLNANQSIVEVNSSGNDPYIIRNDLSFNSAEVNAIAVRYNATSNGALKLFWATSQANGFSAARSIDPTSTYVASNGTDVAIFNLQGVTGWQNQTITRLRLDVINGNNVTTNVDWLRSVVIANANLDTDNDGLSDLEEGTADNDNDGIPNSEDSDSDNDGASDTTEREFDRYSNTEDQSTLDSDNDGQSDLFEMIAGHDPDERDQALDFNVTESTSNQISFQFNARSNRQYKVFSRSAFNGSSNWVEIYDSGPVNSDQQVQEPSIEIPETSNRLFLRIQPIDNSL